MPRYNKQEDFEWGITHLTPFFESRGFSRTIVEPYHDRGTLYETRFELAPRGIELHHQFSLGRVVYRIGDLQIEHTPYLESLGVASAAHYPSYEDNSRAGYMALLHDLQTLVTPFFTSSIDDFAGAASKFMRKKEQGFLAEQRERAYWGSLEEHSRAKARELFFQRRYAEVVEIASKLRFHEYITEPERRMFEIARKRAGR